MLFTVSRPFGVPFCTSGRRVAAACASVLALGLPAAAAHADDADKLPAASTGGLRLSGFGTLGLSHVDAPDGWGYRRELTQPASDAAWRGDIDTRLGLQLNYNLNPSLELVAQVIAKKRGAFAHDSDALEWGYASFRPDAQWTVRAGRVNVDAFLMADYRNVGYGFTTARPPVELYARLPTTLDGGDVARSWLQGDAQWRVKLMAGSTRIGDNNFSDAGRLNAVLGGMVSREEGAWLLRASFARARIDFDQSGLAEPLAALNQLGALPIPSVAGPAQVYSSRLTANGIRTTFAELGARFEDAGWTASAEYVHVDAAPLTVERTAQVTIGRRLGDLTPYLSYSRARNGVVPLAPPVWQAVLTPLLGAAGAGQAQALGDAAVAVLNGARLQQSSLSLGMRWDVHPQAAMKVQWDRVKVAAAGASLWTGADSSPARARVASVLVDFIF